MTSQLSALAQELNASLDPRTNKKGIWCVAICATSLLTVNTAELSLRAEEQKPGFSISLLQIAQSDSYPLTTRLASAICFKNLIKRNWTDEEGNYKLPQQDVGPIKAELVGLMVSVPAAIQTQLGVTIMSGGIPLWMILCRVCRRTTSSSILASFKLRILFFRRGDRCSVQMSYIQRSTTPLRSSVVHTS